MEISRSAGAPEVANHPEYLFSQRTTHNPVSLRAVYLLIVIAISAGCSNNSPTGQGLAAAGTVGATVAAAPVLIPTASAYHAFNGGLKGKIRKNEEFWKIYDPVYRQRIQWIKKRDARQDAKQAMKDARGKVFLPIQIGIYACPGLMETEYTNDRQSPEFWSKNDALISGSRLLSEIMAMTSKDPAQETAGDDINYSETYRAFIRVAVPYKEEFNTYVYKQTKR